MTLRRRISKDEISQSYDLRKLLGEKPTIEQKELFYELAVEKMVQRTVTGNDVNNKKFTKYSPGYAKKKGVPRESVDMVLNGDMLNSIEDATKAKGDRVKIKVDEPELDKASNHLLGDTLPKRDWFGFRNEDDLTSIVDQVKAIAPEQEQTTPVEQEPEPEPLDLVAMRQAVNEINLDFGGFDGDS